jgi:hypothetical protein
VFLDAATTTWGIPKSTPKSVSEAQMKQVCLSTPRIASWFFLLLSLLFFCVELPAQNSRGTILGHVTDPSGAAVIGAKVTVRNLNTGVQTEFHTNSVGDFVFVNLVPGTYELTVEAQGFKTDHSTGLVLEVDQTLREDLRLDLGSVNETLQVTSDTQMVQTDNTTLGNVLEQTMIEQLPSTGRDITNLLELSAGASNLSGGSQVAFAGHGLNNNFAEVSLNGARPESTSFMVDGVTDTDAFFSGIANIPSEFSVQELKIQNGMYSAEYGQGSGQVNIAIKSGTNNWHGQAYDFIQNDAFQPSSPLQKQLNILNGTDQPLKLPFKQNQFGGTLGGPVTIPFLYHGQDRTFWFFAYDGGRRSQSSGSTQSIQVPTAAERKGDFSDWPFPIYNPMTTGSVAPTATNPTGRTPFPGNQIPSSMFSAMGQKLLNLYPLPNVASCANFLTNPTCHNYSIPIHNSVDTDNETMRVDQNWAKDRLYFTGHIRRENSTNPSLLPYSGSTSFTHGELFGVNWEHSFSASMVNTARFGFNHQFFNDNPDTAYGPNLQQQLGFQNTTTLPALFGIPVINLDDGYQNIGNGNFGISDKHYSYQFLDNLKWIKGKHTFTFGADVRYLREYEQDNYLGIGSISFNGGYTASDPTTSGAQPGTTTGNAVADLLLGDAINLTPPAPLGVDLLHVAGINWNLFVQDDIRVTPRLTVNLGLRYEIPPNYHSLDNNSGWNFNPANGGSLSWVSQSFVNGVKQAATAQGLTPYAPYLNCCVSNTLVPIDKKDFAPRIGIAWRPFPTDRFVVRAGYGIFYDTYMRYYDLIQNFDTNQLQTEFANNTYSSGTGFEPVSPEPSLGKLWLPPITSAAFFSTTQPWNSPGFSSPILNQVNWPYNHNPYNQQWTLDTQYAVRPDMLLDIGYVGSHGLREPTYLLFNTATPPKVAGDPCNYLFDISQATGSNASCLGDPHFQPIDTRVPYGNLPSIMYANANILGSNYNALQVQVRQRLTHGLTYLVSYTWSRTFDELSGIGNVSGNNGFTQNPHDVKADYGPSSFDQPQRLTASGSWELPVGKGKRFSLGPGNWVLGDWMISGIYTLTSGRTFSVYGYSGPGYDQMGEPFTGRYRANVNGNPKAVDQTPSEWFDTSVFSDSAPGTYGDSGKGLLRGPYFEDLDLAFTKGFRITERQKLQFRTELFNVGSNWHAKNDFGGSNLIPGNTVGSCNFGALAGTGCNGATASANLWYPRTLQFSLVYSF